MLALLICSTAYNDIVGGLESLSSRELSKNVHFSYPSPDRIPLFSKRRQRRNEEPYQAIAARVLGSLRAWASWGLALSLKIK